MRTQSNGEKIRTGGGSFDPGDRGLYFIALGPTTQQSYSEAEIKDIIRTGGGSFDPKGGKIYFIASNVDRMRFGAPAHDNLLIAVNELKGEKELAHLNGWLSDGKKVFIDSGIFNLTNEHKRKTGISMDAALALAPTEIEGFNELFERYISIVRSYEASAWGYIELDQGGRENKIKTRARLESMGLRPIPVYHPLNDGWDYFDYLAERYDRICFGNVVQADRATRLRLVATAWERKRKYPDLWIHLLGFTPNEWLYAYPIDSGDSSSWLSSIRWSGHLPRACGKPFGRMDKNFQYVLGSDPDGVTGSRKACKMSAYEAFIQEQNWRAYLARLSELGHDPYPPIEQNEVEQ